MSVFVDTDTKLCVSGITGREGTFHTLNNKRYGTNVVSGVTPGKGGQDVEGIPVFNTFHDAVEQTGANTAMIFVPPRFAADSILEAEDAGIALIVAITEGIPAHDELRVYNHLRAQSDDVRLVGPNCPGILSPGKANVGIIPAAFFKEGNVGVVSRSGTLTYQIGNELAQRGFGNSSIVGIGGDPVPGTSFIDVIAAFEADPETELIVMAGEIGGSAEEEAAEYIAEHVSKPVVAYIAGFTAPPGKTMGHAGAIVSGTSGTAKAKQEALEARGVRVGQTPTEVAEIAAEIAAEPPSGVPSPSRDRWRGNAMRAMVLDAPGQRLRAASSCRTPEPGDGQRLIRVHACGVCRTDLHVQDGDVRCSHWPLVLGHQIVGTDVATGERVGVPWLGWT